MPSYLRRRSDTPDGAGPSPHVLIADDDPNFLAYLAIRIRRVGLHVETAMDARDALAKLRASAFDLLICDYDMPGGNGLDVIQQLRLDPEIRDTYAVMLTAHDESALKLQALSVGYDDFLTKSCSEVEILAKVAAARRMLARHTALDAEAQQWRGLALHDELTGVFTRRFFFEEARRYVAEVRDVGLILFDVDDFKVINDTWGHLVGDQILRDVGLLFLRSCRQKDVIARYGGDEFVLLTVDSLADGTARVAERLAAELSELTWQVDGAVLRITVTPGIGSSSLLTLPTVEHLIEIADRDLYTRKWLRKHPARTPEGLYEYGKKIEPEVPAPTRLVDKG